MKLLFVNNGYHNTISMNFNRFDSLQKSSFGVRQWGAGIQIENLCPFEV